MNIKLFAVVMMMLFSFQKNISAQNYNGELIFNAMTIYERPFQGRSILKPKNAISTISGLRYKYYYSNDVLFKAAILYNSYNTLDNYKKIVKADRPKDRVYTIVSRIGVEYRLLNEENFIQPYFGLDVYYQYSNLNSVLKGVVDEQHGAINEYGLSPLAGLHLNLSKTYVFSFDTAWNIANYSGNSSTKTDNSETSETIKGGRNYGVPICTFGMGVRF